MLAFDADGKNEISYCCASFKLQRKDPQPVCTIQKKQFERDTRFANVLSVGAAVQFEVSNEAQVGSVGLVRAG